MIKYMDKQFTIQVNTLEDKQDIEWLKEMFNNTGKVSEQAYIAEAVKFITWATIDEVYAILDGRIPL